MYFLSNWSLINILTTRKQRLAGVSWEAYEPFKDLVKFGPSR